MCRVFHFLRADTVHRTVALEPREFNLPLLDPQVCVHALAGLLKPLHGFLPQREAPSFFLLEFLDDRLPVGREKKRASCKEMGQFTLRGVQGLGIGSLRALRDGLAPLRVGLPHGCHSVGAQRLVLTQRQPFEASQLVLD